MKIHSAKNKFGLLFVLLVASLALLATGCEDDGDPQARADWVLTVAANPGSLILTAPDQPEDSLITISVFDAEGKPQSGIGVRCETTAGSLASVGQSLTTNASGVATDTLTTANEATVTCRSGSAFDDTTVTIGATNERPSAAISIIPSDQARVGRLVSFSGADSSDFDGIIVEYRWSLLSTNPDPGRDNPQIVVLGEGTDGRFSQSFQNPQELEVSLTVTDDDGATSSPPAVANYTITENLAPTADAGSPQTVNGVNSGGDPRGQFRCDVTVDGKDSRDPDGSLVTYRWNWGDGTPPDYISSGLSIAQHSYYTSTLPSVFTVTLTVFDNGDGTSPECLQPVSFGFPDTCQSRKSGEDTTTVTCQSAGP